MWVCDTWYRDKLLACAVLSQNFDVIRRKIRVDIKHVIAHQQGTLVFEEKNWSTLSQHGETLTNPTPQSFGVGLLPIMPIFFGNFDREMNGTLRFAWTFSGQSGPPPELVLFDRSVSMIFYRLNQIVSFCYEIRLLWLVTATSLLRPLFLAAWQKPPYIFL